MSDTNYVSAGKFNSPAASQPKGDFQTLHEGYAETERTSNYGVLDTSVLGVPTVMGGSGANTLFPKAWKGALSIHNLDAIDTVTISPKIGTQDITVRGAPAIDNLSAVQHFQDDAYAFAGTSINYLFNKGDVEAGGGETAINPKFGNSLDIDAVGKDGVLTGTESECVILEDWERSIRFVPDTITPSGEVFLISKGHTNAASCQYAISYDSTNVYRTIGGTKKTVATTGTVFTVGEPTYLALVNKGTEGKDSFYYSASDAIVEAWSLTTDLRGATTSTRAEMVGGVYGSDSGAAASITNALGHYRQFCRYGEERLVNQYQIPDQQTSAFVNFTTSILVYGPGDSIMNGSGGSANDRTKCWFFLLEAWALGLGYDVLFANHGVNGTTYGSHRPVTYPDMAFQSSTLDFNINATNITQGLKEFGADIVVANSGTNEYANVSSPINPYNWVAQAMYMMQASGECARYGVKYIHNTSGTHTLPNTDYERDVVKQVSEQLVMRCTNVIDWRHFLTNPSTQLGYAEFLADDVHLSIPGNVPVAEMNKPFLLAHLDSARLVHPELP